MDQKSSVPKGSTQYDAPAQQVVRDIRRATRKHYSAEGKIRIVPEGLRGEDSIAALCNRGEEATGGKNPACKAGGIEFGFAIHQKRIALAMIQL